MTSLSRSEFLSVVMSGSAVNERVLREVSLRSAFDAASPSVISGEARVKIDVERVSPWKVLIATLTGVAISAALTFSAMSLF